MPTALADLQTLDIREWLRSGRLRAAQKAILSNAVGAFNVVVKSGRLDARSLSFLVEGMKSKSTPVWEFVTPLFMQLVKRLPEAQAALRTLIHSPDTALRFHVTACLTQDVPRSLALEIVKIAITDKGVRVREKAAEASRRLVLEEMIPEIEKQVAVERNARNRVGMEQELRLLRDGFFVREGACTSVWVRVHQGTCGVPLSSTATAQEIKQIVTDAVREDAKTMAYWRDFYNQIPLATAEEYVDRGKFLARRLPMPWENYPRNEKAIADYTAAIHLDGSCAKAFFARGDAWHALGDFEKARQDYERAVRIQPRDAQAFLLRGEHCCKRDESRSPHLENARADFENACQLAPQLAVAHHRLAWVLLHMGELDGAVAEANLAIGLDATWGDFLNVRGEVSLKRRDYLRAFRDFKKGVRLCNSAEFGARKNYAWLMATCPEPSIRNGKKALEWAKTDSLQVDALQEEICQALSTLAAAHAEVGNFVEAVHQQNRAIRLAPAWAKGLMMTRLRVFRSRKPYRDSLDFFALYADGGSPLA